MIAAATLTVLTLAGPASARDLRFSTPTPDQHIFTKAANRIAETLGGEEIEVKVFPSNTIGDTPTVMSMLQSGALELGIVGVGDLTSRDPSFIGWFLPYQFDTLAEAAAAADSEPALEMMERLEPQGMVGLAYLFPGQRHVLSREPIEGPEDMDGLKIRTFPGEVFRAWWGDFGAAATAIPLPEMMPSLVTGVIDAADVDVDIVMGLKMYTQAPYLTLTNHMAFPGAVLASKSWWDGLPQEERDTIRVAIAEAQDWAIETQTAAEVDIISKLEADGAVVNRIDTAPFRAHADAVTAQFINRDPLIAEFAEVARTAKVTN